MALGDAYVTTAEVVEYAQIQDTGDNDRIQAVTRAVSGLITSRCGRDFNVAASASARVFTPVNGDVVYVADISTSDGLIVKTDTAADGTYATTWTAADYTLWPYDGVKNGRTGSPYERIMAVGSSAFPTCSRRPSVQVTAKWGWAAVPYEVKEAALIQCARVLGRRYSTNGVIGTQDFVFRVPSQLDPDVALMLDGVARKGRCA